MVITKCGKQCIFVNMIGYCCLDDHTTNTKHTEAQCQRGLALANAKTLRGVEAIRKV